MALNSFTFLGKNTDSMKPSLYQLHCGHFSPSPGQEAGQAPVICLSNPFGINGSFCRCKNEACADRPCEPGTLGSDENNLFFCKCRAGAAEPAGGAATQPEWEDQKSERVKEQVRLLQPKWEGWGSQSHSDKTHVLMATLLISTAAQAVFRKARSNETSERSADWSNNPRALTFKLLENRSRERQFCVSLINYMQDPRIAAAVNASGTVKSSTEW